MNTIKKLSIAVALTAVAATSAFAQSAAARADAMGKPAEGMMMHHDAMGKMDKMKNEKLSLAARTARELADPSRDSTM
ncbi:hypothetical protein [Amphibiibacter pelophylacis]|uniref:Uncharacterized protein n=1 Tax=Amphibiibacter pelophylacis TaxID=1799477 RepID=A0ACC6P0V0_9BURK